MSGPARGYGPGPAWGVILPETRRGGASASPPRLDPGRALAPGFEWSLESDPCRWGRVCASAFRGNSARPGAGLGLVGKRLDPR